MDSVDPQQELTRLDEQIRSTGELAVLKAIFVQLNEMIQAYPNDFEIQLTGNEIKQRLMARGLLLKQQAAVPGEATAQTISFLDAATKIAAPPAPQPQGPRQMPFPLVPVEPVEPAGVERIAAKPAAGSEISALTPQTQVSSPASSSSPPSDAGKLKPVTQPVNRKLLIIPVIGLLVAVVCLFWAVRETRKRFAANAARVAATTAVPVEIVTTPQGATVKATGASAGVGGTTCTSNCKLALTPGKYQMTASLDGFGPASGTLTVTAGHPAGVNLTLTAQPQSVRLLTDLAQGKFVVDDGPPVDLQEGQFVLEQVPAGTHTVKVTGPSGDTTFTFDAGPGKQPVVSGPVKARNMIAVLVASFGKQARLVTSGGPWKLAVNGQPQSDASPAGVDLTSFQPGVDEILLGEGKDQRNMSESFSAAPMLTAFLKTDVNAGTLIVSTGQDGVRVFLNDKEYGRQTQRGQLRIQTLGKVSVRVAKSGFQMEPAQMAEVKKGAEVRLEFNLKPQPQFGSLEIHGAMAGAEILVDQKSAGMVQLDGSFSLGAIPPGDHTIELRHDQFQEKRLQRPFRAGQTVVLTAADVVLAAARGSVRLTRNPASATVAYRRGDETESHEAVGAQVELAPGSYTFSASAPGYTEASTRVQLGAGENREVAFALAKASPAAPPPPVASGMAEFEDAQGWKKEGDNWVHKGGGFVPYKLPAKGVFTFTVQLLKGGGVFRAGQIRWCVEYTDAKNYLLYELDRKNFWAGVIQKGQRLERVKTPINLANQKAYTIQIEVTPDRLVQKMRIGDDWKVLDTFSEPGRDFTQGKFGFLIQGNDEIAISDFKFLPN